MSITPFIFLAVYLVGVAIIFLLAILNMYHVLRFGFSKTGGLILTFVFLLLMAGVVLGTFQVLNDVQWREPVDLQIPFINTNTITNGPE